MFYRRIQLAVAVFVLGISSAMAERVPVWTTGTGTTSIVFQHGILSSLGFETGVETDVVTNTITLTTNETGVVTNVIAMTNTFLTVIASNGPMSFAMAEESAIKFVAPWGSPNSFLGGSLKHANGFILLNGTNEIAIPSLELFALKDTDVFDVRDDDSEPVFDVDQLDVRFDPGLHHLSLRHGNLRFSRLFSQSIERPELEGIVVGTVDCEVEVHELEAQIERRARALPDCCGIETGTNGALRLKSIDAVQTADPISNGFARVAVGVSLENTGPDPLAATNFAAVPMTVRFIVTESGATSAVIQARQTLRVDTPEKCPCMDATRLYPGMTSRRSLADAMEERAELVIPAVLFERAGAAFFVEAEIAGSMIRREVHPRRAGDFLFFGF